MADLEAETADVLARLIRFHTVNPPGNEREQQEWLAAYLEDAGLECELLAAEDAARPNLVARLRGERRRAGARLPLARRHGARRRRRVGARPVVAATSTTASCGAAARST